MVREDPLTLILQWEKLSCRSIHKHRICNCSKTVHYQLYPLFTKAHFSYNNLQISLHSTRLYALDMSSLRVILGVFPLFLFFIECKTSYATTILFEFNLPRIKALCCWEMMVGSIFLGLFVKIFAMILWITLQILMRLYSLTRGS